MFLKQDDDTDRYGFTADEVAEALTDYLIKTGRKVPDNSSKQVTYYDGAGMPSVILRLVIFKK